MPGSDPLRRVHGEVQGPCARSATPRCAGSAPCSSPCGLVAGLAAAPAAVLAGTTIVVNTTANTFVDDGDCTLREAIFAANNDLAPGATAGECLAGDGADTITFDVAGTIALTAGNELQAIIQPLTIDGGGGIEIDGGALVSIGFCVCNTSATIRNLTVKGVTGDAIAVIGSATLSNVQVLGNGRGISVSAGSTLSVTDSSITGNSTGTGAGITLNEGSTASFLRTTIADNSAVAEGGGIRMIGSTVTIDQSTLIEQQRRAMVAASTWSRRPATAR